MTLNWSEWTGGTPLTAGDKIVKFVSEDNFGAEHDDTVTLTFIGDEYDFIYSALPGAIDNNPTNFGSFTYTIEVTDPHWAINGVALDSDVTATYGTVTKTFAEIPLVLTSTDGSADPVFGFETIPKLKKLTVTDTINNPAGPGEALFTLNNAYRQVTHKVPEPGTILGLLAVGGLGLVSRFKKQK